MQLAGNENSLNVEEIMKDWYSYGGYNREDLKLKRGEKIRKKKKIKSKRTKNLSTKARMETIRLKKEIFFK